jgi:hypothetical protein
MIGRRDEDVDVEMTFTFVRLFGQDVSRVRMTPLDFAGCRQAKPFRRTLMCLKFRHHLLLMFSIGNCRLPISFSEESD